MTMAKGNRTVLCQLLHEHHRMSMVLPFFNWSQKATSALLSKGIEGAWNP
jgi:hypothetical protein